MVKVRLSAQGVTGVVHNGQIFFADGNGHVDVPKEAAAHLKEQAARRTQTEEVKEPDENQEGKESSE